MRRIIGQRGGLSVTAAAAAAAAVLTVTGCVQTQLGAAVLYNDHRISSSRLAAEVANLNTGYQADRSRLRLQYTTADMPRQVLTWMLRFATTEQVARRAGIRVTPAQAQAQLNAEKVRARQSGDTLNEAAVINGLPPDLLSELGRWIAIQIKLQDRLDHGVPPKTTAGQQALVLKINQMQCVAAKSMHIKINPQYGAFDYGRFIVVPATSTLSAVPVASRPSASPRPQLTPKC